MLLGLSARLKANLWRTPLDWLLPPRCGGCRRLGDWLCQSCQRLVRRLQEPLCPRCGCELEFESANCGCRHRLRALTAARSAAAYEGPLERAIHRFKYEGWRCLAPTLSGLIAERLALDGPFTGLLLAVPLHPSRLRRRGYNQAELLARELRRQLELPGDQGWLQRLRDTPPQVGLDRLHRHANVAGAFGWRGPPLEGQPVLLVDDVATTCSTLEACARVLRAVGAGEVKGVTVARVSV
jgi:ComF family protein